MSLIKRASSTTAALAIAAVAATSVTSCAPTNVVSGGAVKVPQSGIYLGAANRPTSGQTYITAFQSLMNTSGRKLDLHRTYDQWGSTISSTVKWDLANGIIPAVSIKAGHSWASIGAGTWDKEIGAQADAYKALGKPVLLTFHHEPENDGNMGSPADYRAAWRRYVTVFRQHGATNVSFAWIMMAASFGDSNKADGYYPGDDVIDWLAVDGYNWTPCRAGKWRSFEQVFSNFRAWAAKHPSKPIFIAEVGTNEDPAQPGRKAQWIRDMDTTIKGWSQLKAVSWFNTTLNPSTGCNWKIDSSSSATAAWRSLASDSLIKARVATPGQ